MVKTFGPSGYFDKDGAVRLSCRSASTYCFLLYGSNDCHADRANKRAVPDTKATPDWCPYADGMKNDLIEMRDFDRMGLADMTRAELMPMMKDVPPEHRAIDPTTTKPFRLTEHNAGMMRRAIRLARLAENEGNQQNVA